MKLSEKGQEFIEHFGVKGMRWGVRRTPAQLGRSSSEKESDDSSNSGSSSSGGSRGNRPRSVEDLSDAELRAIVNRMNMERQFSTLQPTPASKRAARFVARVVANTAQQQLQIALNNQIKKQLENRTA